MTFSETTAIAKYNSKDIKLGEVINFIRLNDNSHIIKSATKELILGRVADEENIKVSDSELQTAVDIFRKEAGLFTIAKTNEWLKNRNLNVDELETIIEFQVKKGKLKDQIAGQTEVANYFTNHKKDLTTITFSQIIVPDKKQSDELSAKIKDKKSFEDNVSNSIDLITKFNKGLVGTLFKDAVPSTIQSQIFEKIIPTLPTQPTLPNIPTLPTLPARPTLPNVPTVPTLPLILKPVLIDDLYYIIMVTRITTKASLDDELKAIIRERIFDDWLSTRFKSKPVNYTFI